MRTRIKHLALLYCAHKCVEHIREWSVASNLHKWQSLNRFCFSFSGEMPVKTNANLASAGVKMIAIFLHFEMEWETEADLEATTVLRCYIKSFRLIRSRKFLCCLCVWVFFFFSMAMDDRKWFHPIKMVCCCFIVFIFLTNFFVYGEFQRIKWFLQMNESTESVT